MKTQLKLIALLFFSHSLFSQSGCNQNPEVNFPGGRVIMSFDGNVHDDDDIVALPMSLGIWWAAGLKNNLVQVEYNNHVCNTGANENDGSGAGSGDDSQNMRSSANGAMNRFNYSPSIFYDYENQGSASTSKMANEIEKSTSSNPLWILAAGPMETIWLALEKASGGHNNVTIISHSNWNETHSDCNGHTWSDMKNKYQSRGVFFVGFCAASGGSCSGISQLVDQNSKLSTALSTWGWMKNSGKEYNNYIHSRNPFGNEKFDPSDAGMVYYLLSGGPNKNGEKRATPQDFQKLLENPCGQASSPAPNPDTKNNPPTLSFKSLVADMYVVPGTNVDIEFDASDNDGQVVKYETYVNGQLMDEDGSKYTAYTLSNIKEGTYNLKALITDNDGATVTKSIVIIAQKEGNSNNPPNPPSGSGPSLTIQSPFENQVVPAGSSLTLNLSVSGSGIVQHQVFYNGNLVDTDGGDYTPYALENIKAGNHTITAEVTDKDGRKTQKSISFTAGGDTNNPQGNGSGDTAPILNISSPRNNESFTPGKSVVVDVSASDRNGKVVKHEIYVNDVLVDTDEESFTSYEIPNIDRGNHTIEVVVTDNDGQKTLKSINISAGFNLPDPLEELKGGNREPELSILSPVSAANYPAGSDISIILEGGDMDGEIVQYQIFVNGELVDTDESEFTPYLMQNVQEGNYTVKAEVTDDSGAVTTQTVTFNIGGTASKSASSSAKNTQVIKNTGLAVEEGQREADHLPYAVIAPNPVVNKMIHLSQRGHEYLQVIDLSGVVLKTIETAQNEMLVNVSELAPGIYILAGNDYSSKFVIK